MLRQRATSTRSSAQVLASMWSPIGPDVCSASPRRPVLSSSCRNVHVPSGSGFSTQYFSVRAASRSRCKISYCGRFSRFATVAASRHDRERVSDADDELSTFVKRLEDSDVNELAEVTAGWARQIDARVDRRSLLLKLSFALTLAAAGPAI